MAGPAVRRRWAWTHAHGQLRAPWPAEGRSEAQPSQYWPHPRPRRCFWGRRCPGHHRGEVPLGGVPAPEAHVHRGEEADSRACPEGILISKEGRKATPSFPSALQRKGLSWTRARTVSLLCPVHGSCKSSWRPNSAAPSVPPAPCALRPGGGWHDGAGKAPRPWPAESRWLHRRWQWQQRR